MADHEKIFQEILAQATGKAKVGGLDKLEAMVEGLDDGLMRASKAIQTIGQGLDILHLKILMVVDMLLDKGIVTKEEITEKYAKQMQQRIDEMQQVQQEKIEEAIRHTQETSGIKTRDVEECCGECDEHNCEEECESDVVLPSERNEKVIFK